MFETMIEKLTKNSEILRNRRKYFSRNPAIFSQICKKYTVNKINYVHFFLSLETNWMLLMAYEMIFKQFLK